MLKLFQRSNLAVSELEQLFMLAIRYWVVMAYRSARAIPSDLTAECFADEPVQERV